MDLVRAFVTVYTFSNVVTEQFLNKEQHVTTKAAGKLDDLWCYTCETMEQEDHCVDLLGNQTALMRKCPEDHRICMVKRISYTTSTENSTSIPRMWSLARSCSSKCEAGCIIVGERTKLYACTSCCEKSLCNVGKGTAPDCFPTSGVVAVLAVLVRLMTS
ncbi:uncharacterized protein [Anabrus simplex]|uniref:uncharacterized protein n=1 Tax=Anabrus simplex TaxID=316456 RepID=UPI0034DCDBD1